VGKTDKGRGSGMKGMIEVPEGWHDEIEKYALRIRELLWGEAIQAEKDAMSCNMAEIFAFAAEWIEQHKYEKDNTETIEDGFGSTWGAWCPECHKKTMVVVRPGKVQCNHCG